MKKKVIIDGYNLMHQMADIRPQMGEDLESARHALMIRVSGYAQRHQAKTTLVFDGRGSQQQPILKTGPLVNVIYSRPPESADDRIKRLAEKKKPGQLCIVVTSDREIQRFVKMAGCQVLSSQDFIREMMQPVSVKTESAPEPVLNKKEIEEWMRLFREADREV